MSQRISLSNIRATLKSQNGLMLSSESQMDELLHEFVMKRAVSGLKKSLEEVMSVTSKTIVKTQHLKLALKGLNL